MPAEPITPEPIPPVLILPKRSTRSFKVDSDEVVSSVLLRLRQDLDDRTYWMQDQLRRYAKYRGLVESKSWQFEDASHAHIPVTMYTCERVQDALYNAVMSQRPIMQSRAMQKQNATKEKRIDTLLDHEFFVYGDADRVLGDGIQNLVVDGTVHFMVRWVRGERPIRLFERLPAPPIGEDMLAYLYGQFQRLYGDGTRLLSRSEHRFRLQSSDGPIDLEIYEGSDGDLELIEQRDLRLDHLALSIEDLEDIVVPSNCTNPQPPSESNPSGAHHVFRLCTASFDTIKVRQREKTYDLLTQADLEAIETWLSQSGTDDTLQPKEQKDELEGVQSQNPLAQHETVRIIESYDRWDVNEDGLEEDVVFWIICNGELTDGRLARARYLTEVIPPGPHGARRPIEKITLFPVTNRYYGMSLPEWTEGMQDLMNQFFNMGSDFGVLANMPFFFYRAASGLKPEILKLNPGEGYPLDDPRADVYFPQLPNAQGSWMFNEMAMLNQFLERLTMLGQLQYGGIPQGKATAFRTTGTTQAVLQQGDTRIERVLRRLFEGLARVWDQGLALCQRYLPVGTEYRILGLPEGQEAFDRIQDRQEISGQFQFSWRATILNTNPLLKRQTALSLVQLLSTPFLLQLGFITPEEIYNGVRRYIQTLDEADPDQFIKRPPTVSGDLKLTAEQAISMILGGQTPSNVHTVEPVDEHLLTLTTFMRSDQFGILTPQQVTLFGDYVRRVAELSQRLKLQQQMAQLAPQFQQQVGGGDGRPGGPPPGPASPEAATMSLASPAEAGMTPQGMI